MTTTNLKAPKGGVVSQVNGQFYEGGEFIPDTGLYCGKGKNRIAMAKFSEVSSKAASARYILTYSEKLDRFELSRDVRFSDGTVYPQMVFHAKNLGSLAKLI